MAVVPAAGLGTRLGELSGSKEILEVGGEPMIVRYVRQLAASGIERAVVVLRSGKWDIPALLADGRELGVEIAYRVVESSESVPETIAAAIPFLERAPVVVGFPDIVYRPDDAVARVTAELGSTDAPVVLGLFPSDRPEGSDRVAVDDGGRVRAVRIKEPDAGLRWAWGVAAWRPEFTRLLVDEVREARGGSDSELWLGDVVRSAIVKTWPVRGVPFPDGLFLGTRLHELLSKRVLEHGVVRSEQEYDSTRLIF